jgi:hypothetical protein
LVAVVLLSLLFSVAVVGIVGGGINGVVEVGIGVELSSLLGGGGEVLVLVLLVAAAVLVVVAALVSLSLFSFTSKSEVADVVVYKEYY